MTQTQPQPDPAPKKKPRKRLRRWLFWLRAAFVVCLTPVVFVAVAAVMMINREITAPSWIVDQIETRAAQALDGAHLEFGSITARIGRDLHPHVRLLDTRLYDRDGVMLTRVRVAEGGMSPRGLLFNRLVLMQDIRLVGAQINLRRARDGTVAVALASGGAEVGQARSVPQLLDQLDQIFEQPQLAALETVTADGVIVNFDDARARRSWVVDGGTFALDLRGGETTMRANLSLLSGRAGVTTVNMSYSSPRGSQAAQLAVNIDDAIASDIAAQSPALTWLRDVEAPISAALRTELDADGALGPLSAVLEIGQGVLQPNEATAPVQFDAAKAYLTYDPVRDRIAFSEIVLDTEWGRLRADGTAYLREITDGLPDALLGQFQFRDVALNPMGLYDVAPSIANAAVDFRLRFDPFQIELGQVTLSDGDLRVLSNGTITARADGWHGAFDAHMNEIAPTQLLAFWPPDVKPRTRLWITENLSAGRLLNGNVGVRIAPGQPREMALGFEFDGADIRFMRQMPLITNGAGVATISDRRFVVTLDQGQVTPPQGGAVDMTGTSFTILDTAQRPSNGQIDLVANGAVTAVLSLLNQPPLLFLDKANRPVDLAEGRAHVTGRIALPLVRGVQFDAIDLNLAAQLRDVQSDQLVPGRNLTASRLEVTANNTGLEIGGPIRLGAARGNATWTQQFGPAHRGQSQIHANIALNQATLDAFNINLPSGMVTGDGRAELTIELNAGAPPAFVLQSDLRGVRLALPAIGWTKSATQEGNLQISGRLGTVPEIDALQISGGGLRAEGRISLTQSGQFAAATFSSVQIGNWFNAPVTLRGRGTGQPLGITISGGTLDLRRAQFGSGGGNTQGGPMQVSLGQLQITEGIALADFQGEFNNANGLSGRFTGLLNGDAPVAGIVAPRDGRTAVRITGDDAGAVARATGLLENAAGGAIDLTLLPAGDAGTFDGFLTISDIRVRDAPTIAALLDAISVVGLLQQLDGQGLRFDSIEAQFRLTPAQIIVTQASAVGPGLGISIDGIYTLATKQLDLQGVVSPFYFLNGIGSVLTRRGEGLIGFNFNIRGPTADPQVSVNPLSALTPGMFRELFRRPPPEVSQ